MTEFRNSPFAGELDVVSTLSGRAIEASVAELREQDRLTVALRTMLRNGVSIDDLSAASGLTPSDIRTRVERNLHFGEDLAELAGLR